MSTASEGVQPTQPVRKPTAYEEEWALVSILRNLPIIGWFVSDAIHGRADAKYYFAFNLAVLVIGAVALFGYAAVIILALTATAVIMLAILLITMG